MLGSLGVYEAFVGAGEARGEGITSQLSSDMAFGDVDGGSSEAGSVRFHSLIHRWICGSLFKINDRMVGGMGNRT